MAVCPKCQYRLKVLDVKQNCPKCGVNLIYYGFEERFYLDAKKAEMSLAGVRVKLQKIRVGLIGSPLAWVRLFVCLLPLAALLVPVGSFSVSLPLFGKAFSLSGMGVYNAITDKTIGLSLPLTVGGGLNGIPLLSQATDALSMVYLVLLLAAVAEVLLVLLTVLSFLSYKKMAATLCVVSLLGLVSGAVLQVAASGFLSVADTVPGLVDSKGGIGAFVQMAAFAAVFIVNAIVLKKGLPISYKEGDLFRVETKRRVRRKEITIDELPYPIYETEEERVQRLAAIEETREKTIQAAGGEADG